MKTRQRGHCAAFGLLFALVATPPGQANAQGGLSSATMVRVNLPAGVSLDVPKEWEVRAPETGRVFDMSRSVVLDLSELTWTSLGDGIVARSRPASTYALVSVSFQRRQMYTPDELRRLSSADVDSDALRRTLEHGFAAQSMGSLEWMGARRESIRNRLALVAEYRRRLPGRSAVWVQINQIHLGDRVLGLTLAYRESETSRWRSLVHGVRESLRVE